MSPDTKKFIKSKLVNLAITALLLIPEILSKIFGE